MLSEIKTCLHFRKIFNIYFSHPVGGHVLKRPMGITVNNKNSHMMAMMTVIMMMQPFTKFICIYKASVVVVAKLIPEDY